jgi:hypothetical protein
MVHGSRKTYEKVYFDNNVYADLALRRIPSDDRALRKIREAVADKRIVIVPSLEIFDELVPVSQSDIRQFKRRWRLIYKLVDWCNAIKPANELLKDDFISFANTGQADNPYLTGKESYYEAFENLANMTEPPSPAELQRVAQQVDISKGTFADVINLAGKKWNGKKNFSPDDTFTRYWLESTGPNTDESNSFAKRFVNDLAESVGVGEACRAQGLNKLLLLPTILLPVGYWIHSWFDQITKGRIEKPSVAIDFLHCILAAAVGTFVTGDADFRDTIQEIPGHDIKVMNLPELVTTL